MNDIDMHTNKINCLYSLWLAEIHHSYFMRFNINMNSYHSPLNQNSDSNTFQTQHYTDALIMDFILSTAWHIRTLRTITTTITTTSTMTNSLSP